MRTFISKNTEFEFKLNIFVFFVNLCNFWSDHSSTQDKEEKERKKRVEKMKNTNTKNKSGATASVNDHKIFVGGLGVGDNMEEILTNHYSQYGV